MALSARQSARPQQIHVDERTNTHTPSFSASAVALLYCSTVATRIILCRTTRKYSLCIDDVQRRRRAPSKIIAE